MAEEYEEFPFNERTIFGLRWRRQQDEGGPVVYFGLVSYLSCWPDVSIRTPWGWLGWDFRCKILYLMGGPGSARCLIGPRSLKDDLRTMARQMKERPLGIPRM